MELRRLSAEQVAEIYDTYMTTDFPADELKSFSAIKAMMEKGIYECQGLFEGETLRAYACFAVNAQSRYLILDYLAVCPEYRSGGYGSRLLEEVQTCYKDSSGVLLECESINTATDESERQLRSRRISFYLRNGCRMTPVKSRFFGVEFEILFLPLAEQDPDVEKELKSLYQLLFPADVYKAQGKVWVRNRCLRQVLGWDFDSQSLQPKKSLFQSLHLDQELPQVISFVGAGGKTTTMYQLADELAEMGKRVLVTTSTHIGYPKKGRVETISHWKDLLSGNRKEALIVTAGTEIIEQEQKKLSMPKGWEDPQIVETLLEEFDVILLEADGAKGRPLKVPADYEPVLVPQTELVVAVAGLSAIGCSFQSACFRMETWGAWLHRSPEEKIEEEDLALILMDQRGGRKGIDGEACEYRVVLNQADDQLRGSQAKNITPLLPAYLRYGCTVTSYERDHS